LSRRWINRCGPRLGPVLLTAALVACGGSEPATRGGGDEQIKVEYPSDATSRYERALGYMDAGDDARSRFAEGGKEVPHDVAFERAPLADARRVVHDEHADASGVGVRRDGLAGNARGRDVTQRGARHLVAVDQACQAQLPALCERQTSDVVIEQHVDTRRKVVARASIQVAAFDRVADAPAPGQHGRGCRIDVDRMDQAGDGPGCHGLDHATAPINDPERCGRPPAYRLQAPRRGNLPGRHAGKRCQRFGHDQGHAGKRQGGQHQRGHVRAARPHGAFSAQS